MDKAPRAHFLPLSPSGPQQPTPLLPFSFSPRVGRPNRRSSSCSPVLDPARPRPPLLPPLSLTDARAPLVNSFVLLATGSRTWHRHASTPAPFHLGSSEGQQRHDKTSGPHSALLSSPLPSPPSL